MDAKILQDKITKQEAMVYLSIAISTIALFKRAEFNVNRQAEFDNANNFALLVFAFTCGTGTRSPRLSAPNAKISRIK